MKNAIRDPAELCRLLRLPRELEPGALRSARLFPVFAPRDYVAKMVPGDPEDPLLRQVLPLARESELVDGDSVDPVGDRQASLQPGLIQKYHGRVLMVTTGACAVHCRYCFRRHFPYHDALRSPAAWQSALQHVASDERIHEVVLSGGDPWTLVDEQFLDMVGQLASLGHVRRIRVHTRLPIMIPQRVTEPLLRGLSDSRLASVVVVHANHPSELDEAVCQALTRLVDAGLPVLNQSVLLRGVNDNVPALEQLCLRLVDHRVMPYYLHQLDRVRGAAHFEVPIARGCRLIDALRRRLPGYAVPRYVQEVAGEAGKRVLA